MPVTSAKAWRHAREIGFEFAFSPEFIAMIRPVEVDFFLRVGRIPDTLAPLINEVINGRTPNDLVIPPREQLQEHAEWMTFLNDLCVYAFVEPKVKSANEPLADDEISVDDISYLNKVLLYKWFTRPARLLRAISEKQVERVSTMAANKSDQSDAESDIEHQPMGQSANGNAGYMDSLAVR